MTDEAKLRSGVAGFFRGIAEVILPKANERPDTFGQLAAMAVRSTVGHAAAHLAGALAIVPCGTCRQDATRKKVDGDDSLYACADPEHGSGEGWEAFAQPGGEGNSPPNLGGGPK